MLYLGVVVRSNFQIAMSLRDSLYAIDRDNNIINEPTSIGYLKWMCSEVMAHHKDWPSDKVSRWIGYVQGVMVCKGWTTVDEERDRVADRGNHEKTY